MKTVRRPFWVPASNYYVLAVAVSTGFFFIVWGILHDSGDEAPWITAGTSASILLCGGVILREIVLRRARNRFTAEQRRLQSRPVRPPSRDSRQDGKLTLERNAAILNEIQRKSGAARTLNKVSAGHREVFELCAEYIAMNETELHTVSAGSPRLSALLRGRSAAADLHRFHMLRWTEIEVTSLTNDARSRSSSDEKVEAAAEALDVIDQSLAIYPAEQSLLQSRELLQDLVVSIKVSGWIEKAERAEFKGEYALAKSHYRDALFDLGRDNANSASRGAAAERINAEIERLRAMESSNEG